jgi:hypothetical protein
LRRNITDLVQKKGAFIGQLEAAKLLRYGSSGQPGVLFTRVCCY